MILTKARNMFRAWFDYHQKKQEVQLEDVRKIKDVKGELDGINCQMLSKRIELHTRMRPYFVLVLISTIMLIYMSRLLYEEKIQDFISQEGLFWLKWYFYLYGTSIARE